MPPFCWSQQNGLWRPFCARPQNAHHVRGNTKMMLTIFVSLRKWSARHALPPSCPFARHPLPLPTQTQNGSQGRFCAKEGHIKNDHLPAANSRKGYYGCVCPPYIQIKKKKNFPLWVLSAGCVRFCIVCCPPCPCRPPRIIYGMADNRRTTGGQQTEGFANLLSALKSPTYQGFAGLADKADNRVVKIVFLSA